jgi:hypothetical protein
MLHAFYPTVGVGVKLAWASMRAAAKRALSGGVGRRETFVLGDELAPARPTADLAQGRGVIARRIGYVSTRDAWPRTYSSNSARHVDNLQPYGRPPFVGSSLAEPASLDPVPCAGRSAGSAAELWL